MKKIFILCLIIGIFESSDVSAKTENTEKNGFHRVAVKPKNFNEHKQGYKIERSAIHVLAKPATNFQFNTESGWMPLGGIQLRNTLKNRVNIEHVQFQLRLKKDGVGPIDGFLVKISGKNLKKENPLNRTGDVLFSGLNFRIKPEKTFTIRAWIKPNPKTSFFPQIIPGKIYISAVGGNAAKPSGTVFLVPIAYDSTDLASFEFDPQKKE